MELKGCTRRWMKEIIKQIEYRANTICSANYQNLNVVFSILSKQCKDTYFLLAVIVWGHIPYMLL